MLRHPPFDISEYSCLTCPEKVVDFVQKLDSLEARKAELELQKRDLEAQSNSSLLSIKEAVINDVGNVIRDQQPEHRRELLGKLLPTLKTCLQRGNGLMDGRRTAASMEIMRLYARFDVDAFQADISQFVEDSGDGVELREALLKIDQQITATDKAITEHWKTYETCFESIPMTWRSHRIGLPEQQGLKRDIALKRERRRMAERILRSFVRDWTDRAGMFADPATVCGFVISSLPKAEKKRYSAAYEKLGLHKQTKRPAYKAMLSHKREPVEAAPIVHNPLFTKEGVNA